MIGDQLLAREIARPSRVRPFSVASVTASDASTVSVTLDGEAVTVPVWSVVGAAPKTGDRVLVAWNDADPILVGGGIGKEIAGTRGVPVVVAAASGSGVWPAYAHFVCDGVNDEIDLEHASKSPPYRAWLSPGVFYIDASASIGSIAEAPGQHSQLNYRAATVQINAAGTWDGVEIYAHDAQSVTAVISTGGVHLRNVSIDGKTAASFDGTVGTMDRCRFTTDATIGGVPNELSPVVGCHFSGDLTINDDNIVLLGSQIDGNVTVDSGVTGTLIVGCRIGGTVTDNGTGTIIIDDSGGATSLSALTDVDDALTPSSGDVLGYDGTEWTAVTGGATDLAGLTDVDDALSPTTGHIFRYDGTKWTSVAGSSANITDDATGRSVLTGSTVDANLDGVDAALAGIYTSVVPMLAGTVTAINDADHTMADDTERLMVMTGLTAARTVTLRPAVSNTFAALPVVVVDGDGTCDATDTITVEGDGTDTINGAASTVINTARGHVTLVCDPAGGNWLTV